MVKIADFGMSRAKADKNKGTPKKVAVRWTAPELLVRLFAIFLTVGFSTLAAKRKLPPRKTVKYRSRIDKLEKMGLM